MDCPECIRGTGLQTRPDSTFAAAGSALDKVVKAQVFLTDLSHFHGFDTVWKRYFKVPPARTTVGCTGLLVKDTLAEIDLIGYRAEPDK